jgi:hypothetical protein
MTPHSEVAPDPQKIDHFFGESVERQKNNKTVKTKMNTMTELEQIESYFKVEFSKMTNDQLKKYITAIEPNKVSLSGLDKSRLQHYIFMCMRCEKDGIETLNKADASIIFNSVAPSKPKKSGKALTITCSTCGKTGHNKGNEKFHPIVSNEDKAELRPCYKCGVRGGRYSFDGGEELYEVDDEWYCGECKDTLPTEEDAEEGEKEFIDACLNDDFDTMKSLFEQKKNKSFNPDDLDLIIIKGGAPEPIPIVKIKPCVEQTPIEKPILRDSNYDAVIAEINAGACSFDNAIRMNKYILKVRTYTGTEIPTYSLEMVKRFGCCPHDNIWDGGKRNTYTVGNIFGETKLQVTPDGQIIYDKTYFKGKDKQKYFATRWFERPESSGWQNSYLYEARGYHSSGIEVLGMKGRHLTKDGKYKYEGVSIADLKEACKKNGIKGVSGKDKHELVKLLMKV